MSEQPSKPSGEKLQKVLARAGFGSRREMEAAISSGCVIVNGSVASLGDRVSDTDKIDFNGKRVPTLSSDNQSLRVLLYNKPEGEICARSDPEGRPTVFQRLPRLRQGRWIAVGRLDFNTTGVLLFTNDGDLANALMHPSSNIDREYLVRIQGAVDEAAVTRLKEGILLDDGVARFTDIRPGNTEGSHHWYYCVVMEGRNREVRRLWESQSYRVSRLKRVRYGNIFLPSTVRMGQWAELNPNEIKALYETAGLPEPMDSRFTTHKKRKDNRSKKAGRQLGGAPVRSGKAPHSRRS